MKAWHLAGLAALVFALHASVPGGGFHYDDRHAIVDNPHLRSLSTVARAFTDPAVFSADRERGMYRPVLVTSFVLGHALHGGTAEGYLRTNRLLHAANAVLVAGVAAGLGAGPAAALLAGGLFGLHPAASEPAHYISARSDSLMAFFFLVTLLLWLRPGAPTGRGRGAALVTAALALWTKSTAVMLAPTLLVVDVAAGRRGPWVWWVRRHAPVWGLVGVYLALSWWTRFLPRSLAASPRDVVPQFLTQLKAVIYYMRLCVWPVDGSVEPAFGLSTTVSAPVVAAALVAATLVVVGLGGWRRWPASWLAPAAWAGLALLPVLVVPLNVLVNERRAYLPLAGAAVLIALAVQRLTARGPARQRRLGRALAVTVLVLFALLAHGRGGAWASEIRLWQAAVERGPAMPRAQLYLGDAHLRQSRTSAEPATHRRAARAAYETVVRLQPSQRLLALQALNGLALLDMAEGRDAAAQARLERALAEHPEYVDARVNLGNVFYGRARAAGGADRDALGRAVEHYRQALARSPQRFEARLNLGACYHLAGDLDAAQAAYEEAARLAPQEGTVWLNLGHLYRQRAAGSAGPTRAAWLARADSAYGQAAVRLPGSASVRRGQQAVAAERRAGAAVRRAGAAVRRAAAGAEAGR